jgi:mannose-6-phosphate isomerase-like protein (cupin superfamily)
MQFQYPHIIENGGGETLIFKRLVKDAAGDYLEIENTVFPNAGPPMHVHHQQEEALTVIEGSIAVEILGTPPQYFGVGETIVFPAGQAHRFWNSGSTPLRCTGWIKPAHNFEYFLSNIYQSMSENGGKQPKTYDAAWLLTHYHSEFDMLSIPIFVKKIIFPIVLFFGKIQGKQYKFKDALPPLTPKNDL